MGHTFETYSTYLTARSLGASIYILRLSHNSEADHFARVRRTQYYYQARPSGVVATSPRPPPVKGGLWGLTMYDGTGFVVRNDLDHIFLSVGSDLTYEGWTLVDE